MPPQRDLLPALTPLRFPAALVVFVVHAWMLLKGANPLTFVLPHFHLAAAVQFFFLLSGFILTHNYLNEFRKPTAKGTWNFYVARWARVYPVHALTAALAVPGLLFAARTGAVESPLSVVLAHTFLLQAFVPPDRPAAIVMNGPAWTLSAEWFFYLLLPILIPLLTAGPWWRRGAALAVVLAPWALAVASVAGAFALPTWAHPYSFPPIRAVDFVVGVLLGAWWNAGREARTAAPWGPRRAAVMEFGALAGFAAWVWGVEQLTAGTRVAVNVSWIGVYLPPFAALMWVLAVGRGPVSRALVSKVPTYLGEISFAFYMLHMPVFGMWARYGHKVGFATWDWPAQWCAAGAVTAALAVLCYHLFEMPLRDRLRKALSFRKPKALTVYDAPPPPVRDAHPAPVQSDVTRRAA